VQLLPQNERDTSSISDRFLVVLLLKSMTPFFTFIFGEKDEKIFMYFGILFFDLPTKVRLRLNTGMTT